ncbi:MAG: hypothetical protein LC804_20675 [Acidobacteria bacterium]|nr:hypothetical protein [Acidobacteriota bacterium]
MKHTDGAASYDDGIPPGGDHNEDVAHEHSDINVRGILVFASSMAAMGLVSSVLMWLLFGYFDRQATRNDPQLSPLARPASQMPDTTTETPFFGSAARPQLLTNEPVVLEKQRSGEDKQLGHYGWIDEKTGVAHIPIGEAKKLIIQRGLPVRAGDPIDARIGTHAPAMGESSSGRTISAPRVGAPAVPEGGAPKPPAQPPHGGEHK